LVNLSVQLYKYRYLCSASASASVYIINSTLELEKSFPVCCFILVLGVGVKMDKNETPGQHENFGRHMQMPCILKLKKP
jgi:hypothetical protein